MYRKGGEQQNIKLQRKKRKGKTAGGKEKENGLKARVWKEERVKTKRQGKRNAVKE